MAKKIIGIGETVLDIVFRGGQPIAAVPGGSTFNAMVSLGRTAGRRFPDIPIIMITQVGDDQVADIITDFMLHNGLSTEGVKRVPGTQSTVSMAVLDENNDAHYEFFRDRGTPPFEELPELCFEPGDLVVFGSFFAISTSTRGAVKRLVDAAHAAGAIIYYDINFRRSHLADLPTSRGFIMENCAASDVVRGSADDIEFLFCTRNAAEVYEKHISPLCGTFICTKGADSTEVFSPAGRAEFPVAKIDTVTTIGAGDNFNAGFVYALLAGGFTKERIAVLTPEDWAHLVPIATKFSAAACQSLYNYVDEDFIDNL